MSKFTHEGTEALQHLADEVEAERKAKGHTPFDDIPEDERENQTARSGSQDDGTSPRDEDGPARAEAFGRAGQVQSPGL